MSPARDAHRPQHHELEAPAAQHGEVVLRRNRLRGHKRNRADVARALGLCAVALSVIALRGARTWGCDSTVGKHNRAGPGRDRAALRGTVVQRPRATAAGCAGKFSAHVVQKRCETTHIRRDVPGLGLEQVIVLCLPDSERVAYPRGHVHLHGHSGPCSNPRAPCDDEVAKGDVGDGENGGKRNAASPDARPSDGSPRA